MKSVIQEEKTGCGIASAAALAGKTYQEVKSIANSIGIYADDSSLWSESKHVCKILNRLDIETSCAEILFKDWQSMPDSALLATKWHIENGKPYWHWAVFVREELIEYVLDSNASLENNIITNLESVQPKWFIKVTT